MPAKSIDIKVSVCVITYNHIDYINKCLDAILGQHTNFDFEVVIGEDCSPDGTASIIDQYAKKHSKIKFLKNNTNLGANANFKRTLEACKGKYIAFCEGDDYWISEKKLQKQVDFLEKNPQYGGVSTNNRWFLEKENVFEDGILEEGIITFEDLSSSNRINSQTALFKKELVKDLAWMNDLKIGDWALHLLVTSQQPYYRLPDITSVYRVHEGGVHSLLAKNQKIRNRIGVLVAVLENVDITNERKALLRSSIQDLCKKLLGYNPDDIKSIRKQYFEYGGTIFDKKLLKSYFK